MDDAVNKYNEEIIKLAEPNEADKKDFKPIPVVDVTPKQFAVEHDYALTNSESATWTRQFGHIIPEDVEKPKTDPKAQHLRRQEKPKRPTVVWDGRMTPYVDVKLRKNKLKVKS